MFKPHKWMNSPAVAGHAYYPTTLERLANCLTHLAFLPVSLSSMLDLHAKADTSIESSVVIVYGIICVILFFTSSAYHMSSLLYCKNRLHSFLHVCDRLVIYLFIAASHTPWLALKSFHSSAGLSTLWLVWTSAVVGITFQCLFHERYKLVSLSLYFSIGILPCFSILYAHETSDVFMMALSGVVYAVGVIFFKLDGHIPMAHAIWHCFVSLGAYIHYSAFSYYLE